MYRNRGNIGFVRSPFVFRPNKAVGKTKEYRPRPSIRLLTLLGHAPRSPTVATVQAIRRRGFFEIPAAAAAAVSGGRTNPYPVIVPGTTQTGKTRRRWCPRNGNRVEYSPVRNGEFAAHSRRRTMWGGGGVEEKGCRENGRKVRRRAAARVPFARVRCLGYRRTSVYERCRRRRNDTTVRYPKTSEIFVNVYRSPSFLLAAVTPDNAPRCPAVPVRVTISDISFSAPSPLFSRTVYGTTGYIIRTPWARDAW